MAKTVKTDLIITINGKQIENSFTEISKEVKKLETDIKKLTPGTEAFNQKAAALKEAKAQFEYIKKEIEGVNDTLNKSGALLDSTKGRLSKFAEAVTTVVTGNLLTDFLSNIAGAAKDSVGELLEISDAMTGVEKTSGLAAEKVRELWNDFDALDTRTGKKELLDIAQIGGRLGITDKEQLREFTEEIDKIYVALGDSFQGGLEAVTTKVGKLKNLFEETKEQNYGEALNAIGSALNELGANGTASEENISDFATRIGQLPGALKPTISQTLGLGAAFEESGIDAEIAASGYSRFMSVAGTNVDAFAKQMRMSAEEAKALFETKPEEFFLKFAQSMKGLGAEGTAEVLKGLKLNTLEVQKAIGAAGDNADRFRELMQLAGAAMEEGTSIQEEFNKVNNNTAAIWEKIKKVWKETFTSDLAQGFFSYIIQALGWLTGVTSEAGNGVKVFRERIAFLFKTLGVCTVAVVSYKAAVSLAAVATKQAWQQSLLYNAVLKVKTALMQAGRAAALLYAAAKAALTGNIQRATAAMRAFNMATKLSPLGLLVGVIGAATAAYMAFNREQKQALTGQKLHNDAIKEANVQTAVEVNHLQQLLAVAKDVQKPYEERRRAVAELNRLVPEYNGNLTVETAQTEEAKKALDRYVESLRAAAREKYLKAIVDQKAEALAKAEYSSLEENISWYQKAWNSVKSIGNMSAAYQQNLVSSMENKSKRIKEAEQELKTATDQLMKEQAKKVEGSTTGADTTDTPLVGGGGDKEGKTAKAKDYSKEYEAAKRARLEAEQALQKEIAQGLEESLDKQLATTEQKYNEKKFKLQQENATLEQEIGTLAAEKSNDPNREKAIAEKRKLMELNKQIEVAYEQQKEQELLQVREKYHAKEAERRVKERSKEIEALRRQKSEEIIEIQSLEDAKAQLKGQLSERELAQIKTLEAAKKALRVQAEKELLEESLKNFEEQKQILMGYLSTLTGEAKEKLKEDITQIEDKMLQAREKLDDIKNNKDAKEEKAAGQELEKVDVLGFTAKDWEDTFSNLDEMSNRFKAVDMVVGAMSNAFSMFAQLQQNLNQKELATYTKNQEQQKQALLTRLNQGYISQAQYQKELKKLEEEAQAKKKELAVKQFQAQKAMNMMSIVANTATGIMRAYSDAGPIAGSVFAAIVGAMGAVQLGIVAAQQPPSYARGGYTKGLGFKDESGQEVAGIVHGDEYVVPQWLKKDPEVAQVVEWLEAKRLGQSPKGYEAGGEVAANSQQEPQVRSSQHELPARESNLTEVLGKLNSTVEKLQEEGIEAYIVADAKAGKEFRRAIKDFETLKEKSKR
jgi:phage tail tape measure protein, TP901 family|nr:MAG TPA: tail tape measure protein [Caudoviricetes sp.]